MIIMYWVKDGKILYPGSEEPGTTLDDYDQREIEIPDAEIDEAMKQPDWKDILDRRMWRAIDNQERASKKRKPRRNRKLINEVKRLLLKHSQSDTHIAAGPWIHSRICQGLEEWRKGPSGEHVTIKTIREIIRELRSKKKKEPLAR